MAEVTIQQIIDGMPSRLNAEGAKGLSVILQFQLAGEQATNFHAIINDSKCRTHLGIHENPTLTLKMSMSTYMDMVKGKLSGQEAFFKRKLRFEGPISLAVKLHRLFKPVEF